MSLSEELAAHLPYLRRYARALTGSQASGDSYVVATLQAIVEAPGDIPRDYGQKVGLYRTFNTIWASAHIDVSTYGEETEGNKRLASNRLAQLTVPMRQALLLTALEGFSNEDAARILDIGPEAVKRLIIDAVADIDRHMLTDVLIIEDEPIIALDIKDIVARLGHRVVGVADTRDTAIAEASRAKPGLILADIQLADGTSGIDAVSQIQAKFTVPVVFITAYPERLLTGARPEPTFLVTKPFRPETLRAVIAQALFSEAST